MVDHLDLVMFEAIKLMIKNKKVKTDLPSLIFVVNIYFFMNVTHRRNLI